MPTKSINRFIIFWLFIALPLLAILVYRKSFNLGLYGDDWQHLYYMWKEFYVYKTKSFFDIKSYLNPYWPNYFYLGIINHFWGFYPPAYFIASFLCRLFANIALYFFSFHLTKSKLAAFLTTLIFLVSAAGLQTTDWVFNMNTYAGLGLLTIASTIYLKIRKLKTFKSWYFVSFIATFTLALAIVPTRMHGAVPFIILMELFLTYIVEKQKIKFDQYLLGRVLLVVGIFYLLVHFRSFGEESYAGGRFNESFKLIQTLIQNGAYSWWLYFLGIIGHLVLPDNINLSSQGTFVQQILPTKNPLAGILVIEGFISTAILTMSTYALTKSKRLIYYLPVVLFNILLLLFLMWMNKIDKLTSNDTYFAISLGIQFVFWSIWFYIISKYKYPFLSQTLLIPLIWITSLTSIYWLFTPYYIIETTGRYMTMGAAGMAIFIGALLSILWKNAKSYSSQQNSVTRLKGSLFLSVPLLILVIILIVNFQTEQNYFNILYQTRNKDLTERSWNKLVQEVPKLDPTAPSVFYFTTDNPLSLEGVFIFGFFMRAGMTYQIPVMELTPLPVTNYKELLDYAEDGSPLQKVHGRPAAPVPLSRIYAFDFRNGELINITNVVRQKISQDLNMN